MTFDLLTIIFCALAIELCFCFLTKDLVEDFVSGEKDISTYCAAAALLIIVSLPVFFGPTYEGGFRFSTGFIILDVFGFTRIMGMWLTFVAGRYIITAIRYYRELTKPPRLAHIFSNKPAQS